MRAIEFTAQVTDSTITIPEAYRGHLNGTVRVIVLTSENVEQPDMIEQLLDHPLQIKDFTPLDRGEEYAGS